MADQLSNHRQRQRFVILAFVFGQQRHSPHHAIVIGDGIEKTCHRGGFGDDGNVRPMTIPSGERDLFALQLCGIEAGGRELSTGQTLAVAG